MTICHSCHRHGGRHWISCAANRCQRCERAPAQLHGFCHFCWRAVQKERKAVVAERLAELDSKNDDG
jgi:hypothetical protein